MQRENSNYSLYGAERKLYFSYCCYFFFYFLTVEEEKDLRSVMAVLECYRVIMIALSVTEVKEEEVSCNNTWGRTWEFLFIRRKCIKE